MIKWISIFFVFSALLVASGYGWNSYQKYQEEQENTLWNLTLEKARLLSEDYSNRSKVYYEYLNQYPDGKYTKEAQVEIARSIALQKAEELWLKAENSTKEAFQDYSIAIQAYQKYLDWAPQGKYSLQAQEILKKLNAQKEEEDFWLLCSSKLQKEKTSEAKKKVYQDYLQKYPQGKYKNKAIASIHNLEIAIEEEKYYLKILEESRDNSKGRKYQEALAILEKYREEHPDSKFSPSIDSEIKELQKKKELFIFQERETEARKYLDQKNFDKALDQIYSYLSEYPAALYYRESQNILEKIAQAQEEAIYQKIKNFSTNVDENIQNLQNFLEKYPKGKYTQEIQHILKNYKKEHLAKKILKNTPDTLRKEESLKGASQKVIDILELVLDSWKSRDQERAIKQLQSAYEIIDKDSPLKESLDILNEYFYQKQIERLLQKGDPSAESICKQPISIFPDSEKFQNLLQKIIEENIAPSLKENYRKAIQLQDRKKYQEALKIYDSIFPDMNEHYKKLVETRRQECREFLSQIEYSKVYELQKKEKYEEAVAGYNAIASQMTEKYAKILEENRKKCKEILFEKYYNQAKVAYRDKDLALCLQNILKAEELGKIDVYLENLKLQVTDKVYEEYQHRISKAMEEQRISVVREILSEIYGKYKIEEEWNRKFSNFKIFLEAHDKAQEKFRIGNYKECIPWAKRALAYYENAQIRKILLQIETENEKYNAYLAQAEEYIMDGKIYKAQHEIEKLKAMRGDTSDIQKLESVWFMQMAKKEKIELLEKLIYKISLKGGEWVLDMAGITWRNLPYQRQAELAALYQKAYAQQKNLSVEKVFRSSQVSFELVLIPPGRYMRGSPPGEKDRYLDEQYHLVTISKPFWMAKYEMTQDQWYQVTQEKPWQGNQDKLIGAKASKEENSKHPASYVSWKDIESKFLSKLEEKFSLPTEAQWEYACRSGTTTRFYWGDDINYRQIEDYAWYSENTDRKRNPFPHPVGQKNPNAWRLYDMSGNLYEWCQDWRGEYPLTEQIDPVGPPSGEEKIYRGGMWYHNARFCRSALRASYLPDYRGYYTGFRLVQEISDEKIVIASLNWTGSTAIENIMKQVLEKELRISTEIKNVPERTIWPELQEGTVDIFPDLWLPNRIALFREYVEERKTVIAKVSYPDAYQGFYIPSKIAKKYNIRNIFDLKGKEKLFDINGDGRGDIWVGDGNWDSTAINVSKIQQYGLDMEVFQSDEKRFYSVLKDNMQAEKPIVFYFWEPGWVTYIYDVSLLEEPPYDEARWILHKGRPELTKISCAYPKATIYVGISKKLQKRIPKAYKFFMNWYIPINEVSYLIAEIEDIPDNPAKDPAEVAKEWIKKHPDIIKNWLRDL